MEDIKLQTIADIIDDYIQKVIELVAGKAFREAALAFREREELKVAVRNFIDSQYGNVQEKLEQKDAIIEHLSDLIIFKNEEIENLKHQITPTH